jgi:hypothetical protein
MDDHACRLVDDDDVGVLVDDRQIERLWRRRRGDRLRQFDVDDGSGTNQVVRLRRVAVDCNEPVLDQALQLRSGLAPDL